MNGSARVPMAGPARRLLFLLGVAALGATITGTPARAQAPTDGHWYPWLGCWEVTGTQAQPQPGGGLCIHAKAGAPGVTFSTIAGGKAVAEHQIIADGSRHPVSEGGCQGWETATWSRDGHRLIRRTEMDCGGARRVISGVLLMLPEDRWADIQAAGTPGIMGIQVVHYRPMTIAAATPTGLLPRGQELAIQTSRTAAAAPLQVADVVEASRQLDARVVQALVYERGNGYALSARTLESLDDQRVPADVIDLMVALSFPDFFEIGGPAGTLALRADSTPPPRGTPRGGYGPGWGCYSYGLNPWGYYYPYWMTSYRYGYYPYGYGYDPCFGGGWGGGWGGYWGGGWGGYYPSGGVIIIKNPERGGKVVKGGGYTPPSGSGGSGRTAHPRNPSAGGQGSSGSTAHPSTGSSGSSSSGSSGSNPSRGGDSSGGQSGGRTAHPKP